MTMTLKEELDARRAQFLQSAPKEKIEAYQRGVDELAASGAAARAVQRGDMAPDFTLTNAKGAPVTLSRLLAQGPVVLTFYRGGWCPYCNLHLRAYQKALPEIRAAGGQLVAVTPEPPDKSLTTAEKNALEFEVLSDVKGEAGRAYRLFFDLSEELRQLYAASGNDLSKWNADGEWHLPMPATYVIGQDGRVTFAFVDAEYRNRAEPADLVAAVRALQKKAA
jgi:peroxiredoxin